MGLSKQELIAAGNAEMLKEYSILVDRHTLEAMGINGQYEDRGKFTSIQAELMHRKIIEITENPKNYHENGKFSMAKAQKNILTDSSIEDLHNFAEFLDSMRASVKKAIDMLEQNKENKDRNNN